MSTTPLKKDFAVFDCDAMKLNLVWRGVFEVSDDEAPELETLFIHHESLAAEPWTMLLGVRP